jgi:hypothetical protein
MKLLTVGYRYEEDYFVVPNDDSPDNMRKRQNVVDDLLSLSQVHDWSSIQTSNDSRRLPEVCVDYHCFEIPQPDLPEVQIIFQEIRETWKQVNSTDSSASEQDLIARTRVRAPLVKLPRNRRVRFLASTYNSVAELANKGRQFWASTSKGKQICLKNAALFGARQLASKLKRLTFWISQYMLIKMQENMSRSTSQNSRHQRNLRSLWQTANIRTKHPSQSRLVLIGGTVRT